MARKERKCICCGKIFSYCPTCWSDRLKPAWMVDFCCEDCKTLYETASKFNMSLLSKEEAQAKIAKLNLKPRAEYAECIQRDLKNILDEAPKAAKPAPHEVVTKKENK